jgi:lysophospholipase L1-like esterase
MSSRVKNVALLAGSIVVCVVLAEVALRAFAPVTVDDASVRYQYRQNLPRLKNFVTYERNAYGLRATSMGPQPKTRGVKRVLCLGASTTDQINQNLGDTWCGLLETQLNRSYGSSGVRFETASLGRGGFRAVDDLAWAEDSVAALQPDIVVLLLGINDLAFTGARGYRYDRLDSSLARSRRRRDPNGGRPAMAPWQRRACPVALQLCRRLVLLKHRIAAAKQANAPIRLDWDSENLPRLRKEYQALPEVDHVDRDPDPEQEFHDAADSLVASLVSRHIRTVVLGQPVLWSDHMGDAERNQLWFPVSTSKGPVRPNGTWLANEMGRYNADLSAIAAARGATFYNLDGRVPKTVEYFFDDCHYTDAGSALVAKEVLPLVAGLLATP